MSRIDRNPSASARGGRQSFGHPSREAAEHAQLREYATNPDLFDRRNDQDQAELDARIAREQAEDDRREAEREHTDRLRRLGDDQPEPTVWTLPAYHAVYAPIGEVEAVSEWFTAHDMTYVSATHPVRVERRATRDAIVYEAVTKPWWQGHSLDTETRVVTLVAPSPEITNRDLSRLHELWKRHWPGRFPLLDFGATIACGSCTRETKGTIVPWPCPAVRQEILKAGG